MSDALSIGDFSVITHLSIKTLRDQVGLLEPAEVDPHTGYRRYRVEQIPTAQIIQLFRDLGISIDEVKVVLAALDLVSWRLPRMVDHMPMCMPHTEHLMHTFPRMHWLLLVPSENITSSVSVPKSPGRFFRLRRNTQRQGDNVYYSLDTIHAD
jgi:DNA-binding transcriptional MerR regulator